MRKLCFVVCLLILPLPAIAQQSFSLPSIGLPLPAIGLGPAPWEQRRMPPWEHPQVPAWERNRLPPWEGGRVPKPVDIDDRRFNNDRRQRHAVIPVVQYVPYPVAVPQPPQVIVVQQPPPQVIVVEVPARERREEPPPAPREPEPPFVPTGDRTVYVIPGCYVGNVPPKDVKLAAHCDLKKLTTFNP
ncbi:MAG TPA: hypothetical protein VJ691_00010 [Vicinamibacterales bacterium]|nr:hypothetical protein [Vicinamibacterales bacterium]